MNRSYTNPPNIFGYTSGSGELNITQNLNAQGLVLVEAEMDSVYPQTGAFVVQGNLGVAESVFIEGSLASTNAIVAATTASTSTTTGALTVGGGTGIAQNLFVGGDIQCNGNFTSNNLKIWHNNSLPARTDTGAILAGGYGGGVSGRLFIGDNTSWNFSISRRVTSVTTDLVTFYDYGDVRFNGTNQSTSSSTGSLVTLGGFGIAKNVYIGGSAYMGGNLLATQSWATSTFLPAVSTSTALSVGTLALNTTTDSTSSTTGVLTIAGGAGIAKALYVGGNAYMAGNLVATQSWANAAFQPIGTSATTGTSLALSATTDSTSIGTGTLTVAGGLGVAKNIYMSGGLYTAGSNLKIIPLTSLPAAVDITTGPCWANGAGSPTIGRLQIGDGTGYNWYISQRTASVNTDLVRFSDSGTVTLLITTDSTSSTTGVLTVAGGAGIAKALYVGGNAYMGGNLVATQSWANAAFQPIGSSATTGTSLALSSTTDTTSASTGALSVAGGLGIGKSLWVDGAGGIKTNTGTHASGMVHLSMRNAGVSRWTLALTGTEASNAGSDLIISRYSDGGGFLNSDIRIFRDTGNISLNSSTTVTVSTDSSSTSTGALVVNGGAGIAKNAYIGGIVNVSNTTETSGTMTGSLRTAGGASVSKALIIGGNIHANYAGVSSGVPQIRVSPSTTNLEASIGFYTGTQASGSMWVTGTNVGSIGANKYGIYSSSYLGSGGVPFQITTDGDVIQAKQSIIANMPPWTSVTCSSFTANQSSYTVIPSLTISNGSMIGTSHSVKLIGKGKWSVTGWFAADSVINIGSVNHIVLQCTLNGYEVSHTFRTYNFSFGTSSWEFNTVLFTVDADTELRFRYKKVNNDITGAYFGFEITKLESYQ